MALYAHSIRIRNPYRFPDNYQEDLVQGWVEQNVSGRWYTQYSLNMQTITFYFELLSDATLFVLAWGDYIK